MSWKGKLRETSEPHDFDPEDFQAGAFAVGAEYTTNVQAKGEMIGSLSETEELQSQMIERGWTGQLEEVG